MEYIEPLWTYGQGWQVRLLVLIVVLNMVLAIRLYGHMARARFAAAREGRVTAETFRATQHEPEDVAVFNRAVVNQFESPTLFYAIVAIGLALQVNNWITVILATSYVVIRHLHAFEMLGEHVVMRRRKYFIWSVYTLMALMGDLVLSTLLFG